MNFKGTKGKWEFHESKGLFITTVGAIFRKDKSRLEQRSNAKLISKAPEMLEALQDFFNAKDEILKALDYANSMAEDYQYLFDNAEQLIKEATE
ncbi:TPA: hypothetical protein ACGQK4_002206 [Elizabethkingia anophelis]|nr:hypothetical protein [Elizabethkingia anophelis]